MNKVKEEKMANDKWQNQKKLKKTVMLMIAVLMLILLFFLIALHALNTKQTQKQEAILSGEFQSIKDILEYYGCEFKSVKNSDLEGFLYDIYTSFKYDLYTQEKSNEKFYNEVIEKIASFLHYKNFCLLDETKEEKIEIKVFCGDGKIQKIVINGKEDYFIYKDSQMSLSKYKDLRITEASYQAPELIQCIQNDWSSSTEFGTREAIFQNYYIYFEEGVQTRTIDGKIYHMIFTPKYQNTVINDLAVGANQQEIVDKLGEPTFQNQEKTILGYKTKEAYVFFEKDEISIYQNNQETKMDSFFELVDAFLEEKYSFKEFMNQLTDLWPDYEEYTYDEQTVFLSYPNKGMDIKINYDDIDGIVLYNNVGIGQQKLNQYLEHTEFVAQLQVDNVYQAEQRRYQKQIQWKEKCTQYREKYEKEDTKNRGEIYDYYMKMSQNQSIISVYFIAQNPDFVNCELNENVDTYVWLNEYCFAYSVKGKGIYYYDLKNQAKGVITAGDENHNYKIKSYENGILYYDASSIGVQY